MRLMNRLGLLQLAFTLVIGLSHALPVSAQQIAQSPALGAGVNGRNAASVSVGKEGRKTGEFRQQGPGRWVEIDGSERQTYRFDEVRRDDWSVYLIDRSRNVDLQLDLHTRKVMIGEAKGGRRELYQILAAGTQGAQAQQGQQQQKQIQQPVLDAGVSGRNAGSVSVGQKGRKTGEFREDGRKRWIETDGSGQQTYRFDEVQRDDWSVYLIDRSRNVDLQLDLHTRKVMIGEANGGRRELYQILAAGAQGAQAQQGQQQQRQQQQHGEACARGV